MTTTPSAAASATQAGKAPVLLGTSPRDLRTFTNHAKMFFTLKKIDEDQQKVMWAGMGLAAVPQLEAWYLSDKDTHLAKSFDNFLKDLYRRALPADFVWGMEGRIRESKQGHQDYSTWSQSLRSDHLLLTDRVMNTREFVKCLLYGMDFKLSSILRRGESLKGTGFHEDDQADLFLGDKKSTAVSAVIAYEKFDREARDEWARIARRKEANAAQIREATKKQQQKATSSTPRASSAPPASATQSDSTSRPRIQKLTSLEKDWLRANDGCFRCRKLRTGHDSAACKTWPEPGTQLAIPTGWKAGDEVPSTTTTTSSSTAKVTVGAIRPSDEIDVPESFAQDSDSDSDMYALPLLRMRVGSSRSGTIANALADTKSPVSLISVELAGRLGLKQVRLAVPVACRGAFQGGSELHSISTIVRVPLELENRTWRAGETTLLVAPLESSLDLILGNNFLRRHQISVVLHPEPQLLRQMPPPCEPHDLYAEAEGPLTREEAMAEMDDEERDEVLGQAIECLIGRVEARTEEEKEMAERNERVMSDFAEVFPDVLPALTRDYLDRIKTRHRIRLVDPSKVHNQRGFNVLRKWRERWKKMLDEHLASGRLRPSSSPFASAAFVIPKKDPNAEPRWVNDYRVLNDNTIKDRTPLPKPDEVLSDASRARFWGKIDLTNAFFQTPLAEEDIAKTAVKTPWGLFEWTVMPQGLCNAPATHQARINEALRHLIGVCCHAFVDDVIIYSDMLDDHERNIRTVLEVLRTAGLFAARKKTQLFTLRAEFLGHVISRDGLSADSSKVDKVKNWPRPRTVAQVRGFLGLVQYLRKFIPRLAEYTAILTPLTKKGVADIPRRWGEKEEQAFEAIKQTVTSLPVLRPLDQDSEEPIWLMTDASNVGLGAVLLQGPDWKTAHPCGFGHGSTSQRSDITRLTSRSCSGSSRR